MLGIFSLSSVSAYESNSDGHGYLQKIGNNTNQNNPNNPSPSFMPPRLSSGCNQAEYAQAKSELASAEQSYVDLKSKYYQDWKQLNGLGKYGGTWSDYAKVHFLNSTEVGKIKQIHEQYGGFAQYCYPAPQAGRTPYPVPSVTSGGTLGTQSQSLSAASPTNAVTSTKDILMEVEQPTPIPMWIKNNARWWSTGQISDSDFISGLQYLASSKIIHITQPTSTSNVPSVSLPSWVKGLAGSWADGKISNDYFVSTIQFMANQNIIKISN